MATRTRQLLWDAVKDLRVHPVEKWVRARHGDRTIVDSRRAQLVWEPRRIVPSYAVPEDDLAAELVPVEGSRVAERSVSLGDREGLLDPHTPFAAHTTPGMPVTIRTPDGELAEAGFRPDDADLAGYVVLDWAAFTEWYDEDELLVAHPRDPFKRVECLRSSRHVQVAVDGVVLADTTRATLLCETLLPTRYYIPAEDVAMDLLVPSDTHTLCAYKGRASYWSARVGETFVKDIAWTYREPLHDAVPVRDRVAFFTERLDLTVDGRPHERPRTPWS
ncbi:MAG TPA: DUF427 domain-containing protein [Propionibacteriaceae bacterium]|nr:DUF427 domain-containing protein [Propionibacteriaceae bacterium]